MAEEHRHGMVVDPVVEPQTFEPVLTCWIVWWSVAVEEAATEVTPRVRLLVDPAAIPQDRPEIFACSIKVEVVDPRARAAQEGVTGEILLLLEYGVWVAPVQMVSLEEQAEGVIMEAGPVLVQVEADPASALPAA